SASGVEDDDCVAGGANRVESPGGVERDGGDRRVDGGVQHLIERAIGQAPLDLAVALTVKEVTLGEGAVGRAHRWPGRRGQRTPLGPRGRGAGGPANRGRSGAAAGEPCGEVRYLMLGWGRVPSGSR